MKTVAIRTTALGLMAVLALGSTVLAKGKDFDFSDPKGVNSMLFVLDSKLEPIMGLASGVSGTVSFDPAAPEKTTGTITVPAKNLQIPNRGMEKTLHGSDWIDVNQHKEITFAFKSVSNIKREPNKGMTMEVTGDFTLKGVTKEITVPVTAVWVRDGAKDRGGAKSGDLLILRSDFVIQRKDFDIKKGMGNDVVANDIEIRVSIAGYEKQ